MGVCGGWASEEVPEEVVVGGGAWIVPWISRIARPLGVWRSFGRGLERVEAAARGG